MDWFNFQVDGLEHVILDITTIIACVCLFTWLAKGVFERLRRRYEHQKRTWAECFFNALYEPLSIYVWFYAAAHIVSSVLIYTHSVFGEDLIYKMESVGGVIALWWFLMKWKRLLVQKMVVKSRLHEIVIDTAKIDAIDKVCTLAILLLVGLLMLEATGRGSQHDHCFWGYRRACFGFRIPRDHCLLLRRFYDLYHTAIRCGRLDIAPFFIRRGCRGRNRMVYNAYPFAR